MKKAMMYAVGNRKFKKLETAMKFAAPKKKDILHDSGSSYTAFRSDDIRKDTLFSRKDADGYATQQYFEHRSA